MYHNVLAMRKISLIALVALCFSFPGKVDAELNLNHTTSLEFAQPEIDPALVESILRYVQFAYGYDYECLCEQYQKGELTIDKSIEGYRVTLREGGVLVALMDIEF